MKHLKLTVIATTTVVVTLLAGAACAGDASGILRDYRLSSMDGKAFTLSQYRGDVVVVNFWATWCKPCRKELKEFDKWNRAWAGRGARVVAISIDQDPDKARRFSKQEGLGMTLAHDGPEGLAARLDLPSMPCTFLLDADGRVVHRIETSSEKELAAMKREAESLMNRRTAQKAGAVTTSGTEE